MKLIIDITEGIKVVIDKNGTNEIVAETLWQAAKNGTPIPDNATFGDVDEDDIDDMPTVDVFDKIRTEIDRQEKWLLQAGYTAYNVDIAFDSIKSVLTESEE